MKPRNSSKWHATYVHGDIQCTAGQGSEQPDPNFPCFEQRLDQMSFRDPSQPNLLSDSVVQPNECPCSDEM